jgi:hypothetical protein
MERSKTNIEINRPKLNREQTNFNLNGTAGDQTARSSRGRLSRLRNQQQTAPVQDAKYIQISSLFNTKHINSEESSTSSSASSSSTGDGSRQGAKSSSTSHSTHSIGKTAYLLNYQAPLVSARLPKSLFGQPICIDDSKTLREVVRQKSRNNVQRQRQYDELTQNFFNECEVNEILSNKSNWLNKHKYINTNSYYSAMKIYFPLIKQNNCNKLSAKYMKTQQERQLLEDCKFYR